MYKLLTYLVKFINSYFNLFYAIANGIVFLISLFDSSLLEYGNTPEFVHIAIVFYNLTEFIF